MAISASPEIVLELGADFGRLKQCKVVAVGGITDHDVVAFLSELVGQPLNLIHAVGLVVDWHEKRERRAHGGQHRGQINDLEIVNEKVGGSGAAIHHHQIGFLQSAVKISVQSAPVGQVKEEGIRMKPIQG